MNRKIIIAPSLLSADFSKLLDEIKRVEDAGADWLHLDIMDRYFMQNTVDPVVARKIRRATKLTLDAHLMIENPEEHIDAFADAGVDSITFHIETVTKNRTSKKDIKINIKKAKTIIDKIKSKGKKVGIALSPDTPAKIILDIINDIDLILVMTVWPGFGGQKYIDYVTNKITDLRIMMPYKDIEVDGGINLETVSRAAKAGANIIVAGTSIFEASNIKSVISNLRKAGELANYGI